MTLPSTRRTLAFGAGSVRVSITSSDPAAAHWLREFVEPWFLPTRARADWQMRLSSAPDAYAAARARQPRVTRPRACFALDTYLLSLPAGSGHGSVAVADPDRSSVLAVAPFAIDLVGDPRTRRWRFTALLVLLEIAATRMRRTSLDLHAAAVETGGRAILIVGPKGGGKTTLALYLLRSGSCRVLANDRVFARDTGAALTVHGVPSAVRIRPPTLVEFPELRRGLPAVDRPYLYSLDELAEAGAALEPARPAEFALSPPQLLRQLGVEPRASAPLGAILVPRIQAHGEDGALVRLDPAEARAAIWSNLYGRPATGREPTLFEEMDGGVAPPAPALVDRLAQAVPAYRVTLGPRAYASPGLADRIRAVATGA